jgi:hypothetical protein
VNHDQCANGAFGSPVVTCSWQNGNLHGGNSQWIEGEFVAHRVVISPAGGNTVKIGYDTTEGGDHAYDYLGTYDTSQTQLEGNNPCLGVTGCTFSQDGDFQLAIPIDDNVTNAGVAQIGGQFFTFWNVSTASIVATGPCDGVATETQYCLEGTYGGTSETSITITFTRIDPNAPVVIAWGGHIATRANWGTDNAAVNIGGSPYHMRVNDGSDKSLKVEGETFPARLTIVKEVSVFGGGTSSDKIFNFNSAFAAVGSFSLQDNGNDLDGTPDDRTFEIPVANGGTQALSVAELAPGGGWSVSNIVCVETDGGNGTVADSTPNATNPWAGQTAASIILQTSELVTCTFTNTLGTPTAAGVFIEGRVVGTNGRGLAGITVRLTDMGTGEVKTTTSNSLGFFKIDDLEIGSFYSLTATNKRYTFNTIQFILNDNQSGLVLVGTPGIL